MDQHKKEPNYTAAEAQFHTSSVWPVPTGYIAWKIRNDYPPPKPSDAWLLPPLDAPWLQFDPVSQPEQYIQIVKEYCFEGMTNNDFVPQNNKVRDWYHAPWMHYGPSGREPLHGLTSERYCPPRELSITQQRTTQTWAVGFFNSAGASIFGGMWKDPNNPDWTKNVSFPLGTAIFKLLFTNATNEELPNMVGAPAWDAMISIQPSDPTVAPDPSKRVSEPQQLRLLQMDIATRDDRSTTGWIWGTFMYNGLSGASGYDGMIPVGLQWGNDPEVTQEAYEAGQRPKQVWINPDADAVRLSLHGGRPSWGWNGRLNGPADNFISACQSCHSTAQWNPITNTQGAGMVPPAPIRNAYGQFVPNNDKITMTWFGNLPWATPMTNDGAVSADNSLQLMIGYENFKAWESTQPRGAPKIPIRLPTHRRQGPDMGF